MNRKDDDKRDNKEKKVVSIDELIGGIHDTEALNLPGFMDKEQQDRIEARIMAGIAELKEKETIPVKKEEKNTFFITERKTKNKKRFVVLALAAVLLMGLCLGVAASTNPDLDIEILKFMGLDSDDMVQLDSGEVKIQVYDSCQAMEYQTGTDGVKTASKKEVKVMAASSIGDKNSACIRIETDYELPDDFKKETDYILPGDYSLDVYEKPGKLVETPMGATLGYIDDNGKLGYMIYIVGCENLNKSEVRIRFKDFLLYHDLEMKEGGEEEELLLEGEWELKWRYTYKSNVQTYNKWKRIEVDHVNYYITKVEISPLSVQIEAFRMLWDRKKEFKGFSIDRINYKDGTYLDVGGYSSAGNHNGIWFDAFLGTTEMKTTIDVEKLESIVIGGNEIRLR